MTTVRQVPAVPDVFHHWSEELAVAELPHQPRLMTSSEK
jgi:hypothetical protein